MILLSIDSSLSKGSSHMNDVVFVGASTLNLEACTNAPNLVERDGSRQSSGKLSIQYIWNPMDMTYDHIWTSMDVFCLRHLPIYVIYMILYIIYVILCLTDVSPCFRSKRPLIRRALRGWRQVAPCLLHDFSQFAMHLQSA